MKIETVTGEIIRLSKYSGLSLNYVVECGRDWVADVKLVDGAKPENNRCARVFVSKHAGVATLMELAHARGQLAIKK